MADFTSTVFFAIAHEGTTNRLVAPQQNPGLTSVVAPFSGTPPLTLNVLSSVLAGTAVGNAHLAFVLRWVSSSGPSRSCELTFNRPGFDALPPSQRDALIHALVNGSTLTFHVERPGSPGTIDHLVVELRALKTGDFVIEEGGGSVSAVPAQYPGVAGPNFPGAGLGTFSYACPELGGALSLSGDTLGVTAAQVPDPSANLSLTVTSNIGSISGVQSVLPIDLHLPSECVLLLDRSGSMTALTPSGSSKWDAAVAAANLFSQLYGDAVPELSTPNASVVDNNSIALGSFRWLSAFDASYVPPAGFATASTQPSLPAGAASGSTPIGQALVDAQAKFTPGVWRRRHLLLLTDGMDNIGAPNLVAVLNDTGGTHLPTLTADPSTGTVVHTLSYALSGETPVITLSSLATKHGGQFLGSEPDPVALDPDSLREMFLNVLARILPIELATPSGDEVAVEDDVERVIFVASTATPISAALSTDPSVTTSSSGQANGLSWAIAENPVPGTWQISGAPAGTPLFAIFDVALRMRSSVTPAGLGKPIKLRATLHHRGAPVSGADVRVGLRHPAESVGQVTTRFVQQRGLVSLARVTRGLRNHSAFLRLLTSRNAANASLASSAFDRSVSAAKLALGVPIQGNDTLALRRLLLQTAEQSRNVPLQYQSHSIPLKEVEPGVYEGEVPEKLTQEDGVYTFHFRSDGHTPAGHAFSRDQRSSTVLAAAPSPVESEVTVSQAPATRNQVAWTVTVLPRSTTGRALGPGLGHTLGFSYDKRPIDRPDSRNEGTQPNQSAPITLDNLDGSYSTVLVLAEKEGLPALRFELAVPEAKQDDALVIDPNGQSGRKVKLVLNKVQVLDDKDPCWLGAGEIAFDAVVAPNANPSRAVRTRLPEKGHFTISSGQTVEINHCLFEGVLESGASLSLTLGGREFDFLSFRQKSLFKQKEERLARYHRVLPITPGKHVMTPEDGAADPESLEDWRLWLTLEVS